MATLGEKSTCMHCGEEIEYVGPHWRHTKGNPRHPATPKYDAVSLVELTVDDRLKIAFVQGAKFWEYHKTNGTMWQSDQELCMEEAELKSKRDSLGWRF